MPGYQRGRGGYRKRFDKPHQSSGKSDTIVGDSPLMRDFLSYKNELDDYHDRYERLFKLSRDITIESKRIIFQLHSICNDSSREKILQDAKARLDKLIKYNFAQIAKELEGMDRYQYARAYSPGVQEFVEAMTFYYYLNTDNLQPWRDILSKMVYPVRSGRKTSEKSDEAEQLRKNSSDDVGTEAEFDDGKAISTESEEKDQMMIDTINEIETAELFLPPWDYILGIADLTGELMRHSINSLSSGKIEDTFKTCDFLKFLYMSLLSLNNVDNREFFKKLNVMRQSLLKVENACYTIKLRGSEMTKDMLAHVIGSADAFNINEDEGFSQT